MPVKTFFRALFDGETLMNDTKRQRIDDCIEAFSQEKLTEENLRQVLEELSESELKYQDLLYLQTNNTSLDSSVHGMSIVQDNEISEGPPDPNDWPYRTPLQAIRDG